MSSYILIINQGWKDGIRIIYFSNLEELKKYIESIDKIYTSVRAVDEELNCIIGDKTFKTKKCYNVWNQNEKCEICIYQRAFKKEDPVIKVVDFKEKTYVIKSVSVMVGLNRYLIECIDEIVNGLYYESKFTEYNGNSYTIQVNHNLQGIVRDGLTNLYNRNYMDSRLSSDIDKALKNGGNISLCMVDIDYFKKINDTYGHLVGDELLKEFSAILKEEIRSNIDWVARYGGEEFIIVLPENNKEQAVKISERIRKKVEENIFKINEKEIKITCSVGVYSIKNDHLSVYEFIEEADKNLYKAKCMGRNNVV